MSDIPVEKKKRGRPKGSKNGMSVTAIKKKHKALREKEKLTIYITGLEKDAFDFKPLVESVYRIAKDYISYKAIVRKIVNPVYWKNVEWIKNTLKEHMTLEVREKEAKVKRIRKKKETV